MNFRISASTGHAIDWPGAVWTSEGHHVRGRPAQRWDGRARRGQWSNKQAFVTLDRCDIVIMDNLAAHKVSGVLTVIEAGRARLFYLPPYSPDFNPIEQAFSKIKAYLRKAAERTIARLRRKVGVMVRSLKTRECTNYLTWDLCVNLSDVL
jgi:transposase